MQILKVALFGAAAMGLIGAAHAQAPKRGGELKVAVASEPNTTDCHAASTFTVVHHLAPHYSFLVRHDPANYPKIIGDLATGWSWSADSKALTVTLHDGVKFHDGSGLTSADVKASFERIKTPPAGVNSPRRDHFRGMTGIETPDAKTVVFKLEQADPSFLTKLASPYNCIFSAAKLAADPRSPEKEIMGSGPFTFVERKAGSEWVGKRFDGYFRQGQPYLEGFRNLVMANSAIINNLQGGSVDVEFRGINPAERDRLKTATGDKMTFQESSWLSGFILSFNTEKAPFDDIRVRKALHMSLDRWGTIAGLTKISQLREVGGLLRPGFDLAATPAELEAMPGMQRDMIAARAEARRLLREAGHPNLTFKLVSRPVAPYPTAAVFLIDQWRQIGVTVEQVQADTAQYFAALGNGTFEAAVDFTTEFADEPNIQWSKYISVDRSPAPLNSARFTDRALDALYDLQSVETDPAKRRALLRQMEAHVIDKAYMVPLFWFNRIVAHTSAMKGWPITPSHLLNQSLAEVWLDR